MAYDKNNEALLRRKHGLTDPRANYAIEITDRYLIARVNEMGLHNIKNEKMRKHFERKIAGCDKFNEQESYIK